tara:strand:- start:863 stop:2833 length:1971 start_codon:yes stop_codon:yes gene_type:complete
MMSKLNRILPLLMLVIGVYLVPIGIFKSDFSKIPGDLGDARFNNYILEHGHQFIKGDLNSYWDAPFMFPYKRSITFSDNLLGSLPIYSVCRIMGLDRETAFQYWILIIFVLNFIAALWVLQRWCENSILASVGAYIFAFSIMLVGNIYNVQTLPRYILPFLFYWLWLFFIEKQTKYFAFLAIGLVYQFYCGVYLGFLAFYVLVFFTVSLLLINKDYRISKKQVISKIFIRDIAVTVFVSVALLGLLMFPYYIHSQEYGLRSYEEIKDTIPTLRSYFFTSGSSLTWGRALGEHGKSLNLWWCHFLFIGGLPWVAVVGSCFLLFRKKIAKQQRLTLLIFLLALILSIVFSLKIGEYSLYSLVYKIPGFSAMRSVNRVINTEIFLFILILVFFFKQISKEWKFGKYVILVLPVLVVFDNLGSPSQIKRFEKSETQERVLAVKKSILEQKKEKTEAIAYLPFDKGHVVHTNLDVMLASQDLNVPCVNAYSGSLPNVLWPFIANMNVGTLKNWMSHQDFDMGKISLINELQFKVENRREVSLRFLDKFVCPNNELYLYVNKDTSLLSKKFCLIQFEKEKYAFRTVENKFVSAQIKDKGELIANRSHPFDCELFEIVDLGNNRVAFRAQNNKYWNVNPETFQLMAKSDSIGENETFSLNVLD